MKGKRSSDGRAIDHHSLQVMRQQAIKAIREGQTAQSVATAFGVNVRSVFRWLADFAKGGQYALLAKPIPGRPPKVSAAAMRWLAQAVRDNNARVFTDLSIRDFSIDAGHVNWIATANSVDTIPAPIPSRLTVLHVQAPIPAQVARIAQNIYGRMRAEASWGSAFDAHLSEDVTRKLQGLPPRSLTLALRRALGSAARAERGYITVEDLPGNQAPVRRGMGFTAALSE